MAPLKSGLRTGVKGAAEVRRNLRQCLCVSSRHETQPHPADKGQIIVRYWYLVAPAFGLFLGALLLAKQIPHPSLGHSQGSSSPSHATLG